MISCKVTTVTQPHSFIVEFFDESSAVLLDTIIKNKQNHMHSLCRNSPRYTPTSSATDIYWPTPLIEPQDKKIDRHRPGGTEGEKR